MFILFVSKLMRLVLEGHLCGLFMSTLPRDEDGNLIVRIGHSPDPDDAFMFHAMTTNAFPTPGYNFVHELQDIEHLIRYGGYYYGWV